MKILVTITLIFDAAVTMGVTWNRQIMFVENSYDDHVTQFLMDRPVTGERDVSIAGDDFSSLVTEYIA